MFKYGDKTIRPGKSWTDSNGTQHPGNWNIWSKAEKDALNIKEIIEESYPDSRLYLSSMDSNGKVTSTAKALDDSGDVLGVKSTLKNEVKDQQGSLLSQTDWAYIRHYDTGTEVPANIETWRDAIRATATEMENAIDNSTDTNAIASLFLSWDSEAEDNSMDKFREAAATELSLDILSKEAGDQEKITKEAESKREIEIKKYPFLSVWPELGE
jgi:hypothetical protein